MLVVGLTGGIGSGKTTVADLFAKKHIDIIDTDQLAREVIEPGQPAFQEIVTQLGKTVVRPNGQIDRGQLRKVVFNDAKKRRWLESLLHPLIREAMQHRIQAAQSPYCIAVIPLLLETSPNPWVNRVLVVDAVEASQIERAKQRDQSSEHEIKKIMGAQVTRKERLSKADDIIYNDGLIEDLQPQVDALHIYYLTLASHPL